uniref:Apyrase n=1 Tax=Acrobeloides nanus TaxID=290746 RepID=A0A914EDL4_9BILA
MIALRGHVIRKVELRTVRSYDSTLAYAPVYSPDGTTTLPLMLIADMDSESADKSAKNTWLSPSKRGYLVFNLKSKYFSIHWYADYNYTFQLSYGGRGMELSDLKFFDGHLLAPDDRTGVIFKLTKDKVVPWVINSDGDGNVNKTFKTEWMAIKNDELYVGGYGKEWTDLNGNILNYNPMWIKVIDRFGAVKNVDWITEFRNLRASLGIYFPAYIISESCQWSDVHKKWFFLPRRVSYQPYNDVADQFKGSNLLITADECFRNFSHVEVGKVHPTRGFSAFQFLPGTNDTVIIALKTEEVESLPFATYVMIFAINGTIYLDETKVPGAYKFEGLEFFNWL